MGTPDREPDNIGDETRLDSESSTPETQPDSQTLPSNTRRDILRNALAIGGVTAIPSVTGHRRNPITLRQESAQRPLELRHGFTNDSASIPLPPFFEPSEPVVNAQPTEGQSSVDINIQLETFGAIVSAASPKIGADIPISESGTYRIRTTQTVTGRSTVSRHGDGILLILNFVYPRLCVENVDTYESCVNGFPDLLSEPYPHARLYGQQWNDIIELFGDVIFRWVPWPNNTPDFFKWGLIELGDDGFEDLFGHKPDETTHEINEKFEIETTFVADAAHDYKVWQCFDVVSWALGKPDLEVQWGESLLPPWNDPSIDLDGSVANHLDVNCVVDDLSLVRIEGPGGPSPGRVLTVTKEGAPDGRGAYFVTTDGTINQAIDSEATIIGSAAIDWVGPKSGEDNLNLHGDVTDFILKGPATVYFDGDETSPEDFGQTTPNESGDLTNTLTVMKGDTKDGMGACAVTVTGEIERGDGSEAIIRGRSALDWVGPKSGTDELRFSGEITTLLLKGDAEVYLNGERVYPPISKSVTIGGGSETNSLTVAKEDTEDGLGAYAVTVSGELERDVGSEATIIEKTAIDWVGPQTGTDTLRYTGDIEQFLLKGPANVYLNDEATDPESLGSDDSGDTDDQGDLPHSLRITKEGVEDGMGVFVVAASGSIAPGQDSEAVITGSHALDFVGPKSGTDTLHYSGEITDLVVKGQAAVYRNGERVDPDSVGR